MSKQSKHLMGAAAAALTVIGLQLPSQAQEPTEALPETLPVPAAIVTDPEVAADAAVDTAIEIPAEIPAEATAEATVEPLPLPAAVTPAPAVAVSAPVSEASAAELGTEPIELSQRRRPGTAPVASNFLGIGADLGFADDFSFAIISKISLNDRISLRPAVFLGDDVAVLVPVTFNFSGQSFGVGPTSIVPYAGGGIAIAADDNDDTEVSALLSAGVDVPISRQFTINGQANLSVFNDSNFGVQIGVGYNFGGF